MHFGIGMMCNMTHYGYPRIVYYTWHKPRTHLHICHKLFVLSIHPSIQPFIHRCSAVTEPDAIPFIFKHFLHNWKWKFIQYIWKIGKLVFPIHTLHTFIRYTTCRVNVCQKFTLLTLTYNSCRDIDSQMHLHIIIWNRIVGEGKCHCV